MKKYTKKILRDFKIRIGLYKEFESAVSSLLQSMLRHGEYKYHIDSRVKDVESLQRKVETKKKKGQIYKKLRDIQDVVGVRIIFYTQSDRKRFIQKMQNEFNGSLKIEKAFKTSGYRAIHAIVSLGKERLKLSEYKAFKGLECEVQLCLILEHAWAEIEHDVLYKDNRGFRELDKVRYLYMKERMERIMTNYINKASTELEGVVHKFKKITRNNKIYSLQK